MRESRKDLEVKHGASHLYSILKSYLNYFKLYFSKQNLMKLMIEFDDLYLRHNY